MRSTGAALFVWLMGVSFVHAETSPTEPEVRAMLGAGVEQAPFLARLEAPGESLSQTLIDLFSATEEAHYVRLRALSVLGRRSDAVAARFLLKLLHESGSGRPNGPDALHPSRSSLVLRRAIDGLAPRKLADAEADLTLCLRHHDAGVRGAAVIALLGYGRPSTERSLTLHLAHETSARVRLLITDRSALPRAPRSNAPRSAPPPR